MSLRTTAAHEIAASEIVPGDGREDDPGEDSSGEDEDPYDIRAHGSPELWAYWTTRNLGKSSPERHPPTLNLLREIIKLQANLVLSTRVAAFDQAAEDPKFGERPCGNITLNGDGVGLEDPRDQSRPVWAATSRVRTKPGQYEEKQASQKRQ